MIRDIHGHATCDSCGITGCGHHIVGKTFVKAQIRVVHCPFGWCRDRHLCVLCRKGQKDTMTRMWHRQNGCAAAAKSKEDAEKRLELLGVPPMSEQLALTLLA